MDRLVQHNVLAMSGRAVEAAGDVNTLLLDKTGTITLGNRQAAEFIPVARRRPRPSWPTPPSCPAWPTRPRRAARSSCWPRPSYGLRERRPGELADAALRAVHRADPDERRRPRRRPADPQGRGRGGDEVGPRQRRPPHRRGRRASSTRISTAGGTPLVVAERVDGAAARVLGRDPPQGRRQGGHARAVRRDAPRWASAP